MPAMPAGASAKAWPWVCSVSARATWPTCSKRCASGKLGSLLERRAVVAALCEPRLLRDDAAAREVLAILNEITRSLKSETERNKDGFKVLRQALAYGWSVAVVANPEVGKPLMEKWLRSQDRDIAWLMRENLKKNRLKRMDDAWVVAWSRR